MKIIAIIPARGGSKGVPEKNLKLLGGKPLILHAAECGQNSKYEMDIVVSTDNAEIEVLCVQNNVKVIKRPAELATDSSLVVAAIQHVIENSANKYDLIVLLQATSPFRTSAQLDEIIKSFETDSQLEGMISVIKVEDSHPSRMYLLDENQDMKPFLYDGNETARRQDLKPLFLRNGCFYAVTSHAFATQNTVMPQIKKAFIMDSKWHVNIDTPIDFMLAELVYKIWIDEHKK